jgi:hypothetical protein
VEETHQGQELARGKNQRTPILALAGVGATIGATVALLVIAGFLVYYIVR